MTSDKMNLFTRETGQEDVVYDYDLLKYMKTFGRGLNKPSSLTHRRSTTDNSMDSERINSYLDENVTNYMSV